VIFLSLWPKHLGNYRLFSLGRKLQRFYLTFQVLPKLMVELMYGTGLRNAELLFLRIKDVDFGSNNIFVRAGKGNKKRTTMLPQGLIESIKRQVTKVALLHTQDLEERYGEVYIPDTLNRKCPRAARETAWQFLFPASTVAINSHQKTPPSSNGSH
jgi:integrase